MYAFWVYIIVVCEHYLKVKLFHLLVRVVGSLFFGADILDYALVDKVKHSRYVFFYISIVCSRWYQLSEFFGIIFGILVVRGSPVYGGGDTDIVEWKYSWANMDPIFYSLCIFTV